jgi:putative ABC transport system permease protein
MMLTPAAVLRRLRTLLRGRIVDDEMDEEMRFHLEMEAADGMRRGLPPDEARRRAALAFGGVERFREEGRDARGVRLIRELGGDLRYAARLLRRAPLFTTVVVVVLALGIGANTAIFSVVYTVLLRPLPFPDTESLVSVWSGGHSRAEFVAVRERVRGLAGVASYMPSFGVSVGGDGEPLRQVGALVSAEFFSVLGVQPLHGRFFRAGEDAPGTEAVVVLGHALWRDRFSADPGVVGRVVEIDGVRRGIVGIAPPGFSFPSRDTRLWIPLPIEPGKPGPHWGAYGHHLIGRLSPDATPDQVRDELGRLAEALRLENPVWRPGPEYGQGIVVRDLRAQLVEESRLLLMILLAAVGLILLLACANVANLLVLRGTMRERELAIRATLGAGTGRLVRQLLAESLLIAVVGGALGLALAGLGTGVLTSLLPSTMPRLEEVRLGATTIGFALGATLLTCVAIGLLPARRLSRAGTARRGEPRANGTLATITSIGGRGGLNPAQQRTTSALVSLQIAIGVVLAVGAALLGRSLGRLLAVDPGFATTHVAVARLSPPRARYAAADAQRQLVDAVLPRISAMPGITGAAITTQLPFDQTSDLMAMWIDGWTSDPNKLDLFEVRRVSPDFFRVMGISLRRGRVFDEGDRDGAEPVAVISETGARKFWGDRDAVGGRLRYPWPGWMSVVGVVADVRNNDLRTDALPTLYVPFAQGPQLPVWVVMRTPQAPAAQAALRAAAAAVAPDVPVSDEQTLDALVGRSVAAPRSATLMLLAFGGLALILGSVGTYGLVAYRVESRRRELAVRRAVGADQRAVIGLILRDGLRLAAIGIVAGLALAFGLSRLARGLLFGIGAADPVSFIIAPLLLGATALIACVIPAIRATRVDPNAVLRGD